jgi:hypothetical protein
VELDLESGHIIMGNTLEKMRVTLDKDLDVCYQVVEEGFEKVKVTIDKDFDKFMKTAGFFQR